MVLSMPKVKTSLYIDPELYKRARILAIELRMSFSNLVEEALKEYLEKYVKEKKTR